jgi:hypothetical protein
MMDHLTPLKLKTIYASTRVSLGEKITNQRKQNG